MTKNRIIPLALILLLLSLGLGLYFNFKAPKIDESKIVSSYLLEYPSEYNYRQSINDCGPFNVAALVRILTGEEVSSPDFAASIGWRLPNKYTLPIGMTKQLKENGLRVEVPNIKTLSDANKVAFLQERLSQGKPIIILGERENYEHYISILGFDSAKNEFYAYDSLFDKSLEVSEEDLTIDTNGDLPGNRTYSSEELLDFWRGGGMYGLYEWYAVVGSLEE